MVVVPDLPPERSRPSASPAPLGATPTATSPSWLVERRSAAAARAAELANPTSEEEVWRYSRIDQLDPDRYRVCGGGGVDPQSGKRPAEEFLLQEQRDLLERIGSLAGLVVTHNGRVMAVESFCHGVAVSTSSTEDAGLTGGSNRSDLFDRAAPPDDRLSALAEAALGEVVFVEVAPNAAVEGPVLVFNLLTSEAEGTLVAPRLVVHVGESAEVTVVEFFAGANVDSLVLPVTSLLADRAANLRYTSIQQLGDQVWNIAHQGSEVGSDATLTSVAVALGAHYGRLRADANLAGHGGTSNLLAVYFGEGEQQLDFRTFQLHTAPRTTSDLLFKGAVSGTAHSVYTGDIRIAKGAVGTKAFQTNRNLVLSEGAHADSVPNLEIDENDVTCSHASAVGPIDEQQRFYLEARGVPTGVANRLIVHGFLADILARIPVQAISDHLAAAAGAILERSDTSIGLTGMTANKKATSMENDK